MIRNLFHYLILLSLSLPPLIGAGAAEAGAAKAGNLPNKLRPSREINFSIEGRKLEMAGDDEAFSKFVLSLQPGDVLIMGDDQRFTIEKRLGKGHQHCVFAIQESAEWVLRLPYHLGTRRSTLDTIEGYEVFKKTSLRTVAIHPSSNWEYVLAERVTSNHYTILDFLTGRRLGPSHPLHEFQPSETNSKHNRQFQKMIEEAPPLSPKELKSMEEALVKFGSALGEFLQIHDLKDDQLVYDRHNKEWILLDWLNLIEVYSPEYDGLTTSARELVFNTFRGSNRFLAERPGLNLPIDVRERWKRVATGMRIALLEARLKLRGVVSCERAFSF